MLTGTIFHWARIETTGRNFQALAEQVRAESLPALDLHGGKPWILAQGLFGLWTTEVILVTAWSAAAEPGRHVSEALPMGARIVSQHTLVPTVRPLTTTPPARPGIYVHRFFEVRATDIERFVALSDEAWNTFENTADYAAEPQGLFRERDHPEDGGMMLLVTWYDRLESWERSRAPAPEAAANFRARAALTKRSVAFATRLI